MTRTNKIIALILSIICIVSCFSLSAFAGNAIEDISNFFTDPEEVPECSITYEKQTLSAVSMMYKPNTDRTLSGPGFITVTKDVPIAVDHNFVCWRDKEGNLYYEGDRIFVDGPVTLYAVWEKKTDNDPHVLRVIRTAIATLKRMIDKAFGIFDDIKDFDSTYVPTSATSTTVPTTEDTTSFTGKTEEYTGGPRG